MGNTINLENEIRGLRDLLLSDILPKVTEFNKRKTILLYSLHNPLLKLKEPLAVYLETDSEGVIAYCYDVDVFGQGDTEGEALEDLRKTISDLYSELEISKDKLGPFPEKICEVLPLFLNTTKFPPAATALVTFDPLCCAASSSIKPDAELVMDISAASLANADICRVL